jgi:hypothetical protein
VSPQSGCGIPASLDEFLGELVERPEAFERGDPQPLALPRDENQGGPTRGRAGRAALEIHIAEVGIAHPATAGEPDAPGIELQPPRLLGPIVCTDHDCVRHALIVAPHQSAGIREPLIECVANY